MNGIDKDYRFGQKNNWRRHVWNDLSKRIIDKKRALILYLAGEQDLDRKIAIEKGFHSDNLIIIEKDKQTSNILREQGKIVINAEINDVLLAWPKEYPAVDIIFADFCCGLEPKLSTIHDVIGEKPSFLGAIVLINMMRGRDQKTNIARMYIEPMLKPEWKKHRGCHFLIINLLEIITVFKYGEKYVYGKGGATNPLEQITIGPFSQEDFNLFYSLLLASNPNIYTYKSGMLSMDSIMFNGLIKNKKKLLSFLPKNNRWDLYRNELPEIKRKIAAALAIRTMRLNGTLSHSPKA